MLPLPSALATYKQIVVADPAAGAEWSQTVTAGKWWWLLSVHAPLVQGLTQTPQPILHIDDGTNDIFMSLGASNAQAASTTCSYCWATGLTFGAILGTGANCHAHSPLPSALIIPGGYRIRSETLGIGANSNWGAARLYVCEFA